MNPLFLASNELLLHDQLIIFYLLSPLSRFLPFSLNKSLQSVWTSVRCVIVAVLLTQTLFRLSLPNFSSKMFCRPFLGFFWFSCTSCFFHFPDSGAPLPSELFLAAQLWLFSAHKSLFKLSLPNFSSKMFCHPFLALFCPEESKFCRLKTPAWPFFPIAL